MSTSVEKPVEGEFVRFSHTFTSEQWDRPEVSYSTLRFLDIESLSTFLDEAGFEVAEQFGNWNRERFFETSPEIITIAKRQRLQMS